MVRTIFALIIAAVALVSCGGGGSSLSGGVAPAPGASAPVPVPVANGLWSASLGPWSSQSSGKLNAVAIDPRNASTIYAGGGIGATDGVTSDTGIFKTTNGGASWTPANTGLGDTTINALLFDSNGALYAATESGGIYRSTDGAGTWNQVSNARAVRQLVSSNGVLYAAARGGVLTSSDGMIWTLTTPTSAAANSIAVNGSDVYAGLVDGSLVRAGNAGTQTLRHFSALGAPPVVHAIAIDPANTRSIYVSIAGMIDGIYSDALAHSADAGTTWRSVTIPSSLRGAQAIGFSRLVPHRLYVAGVGLAYTDDASTFQTATGYGDARTLTVLDGDRIALASDQGLALGAYGGSFQPLTGGLPVNIVRSVAVHGSTMLVTMQDFPPARSLDGGATWQSLSVGSNENGVAYINPGAPNICYILDNGVSVSTDGCVTFTTQAIGARIASNQPFATVPGSARTYMVTANGLYVANDGIHFLPIACSVSGPVDIAIDPRNADHLFLSSANGGIRVWRSTDGGVTFARSASFDPPGPSYPDNAPALAVDPSNGDVIAATQTALYRSTDGGATFTALHQLQSDVRAAGDRRRDPDAREASTVTQGYNINEHVQFVPTSTGTMLLVTGGGGMMSSRDDGTTTASLDANAISHQFEGIAADGGRVCAGTDGQGVICTDASRLAY